VAKHPEQVRHLADKGSKAFDIKIQSIAMDKEVTESKVRFQRVCSLGGQDAIADGGVHEVAVPGCTSGNIPAAFPHDLFQDVLHSVVKIMEKSADTSYFERR